MTVPYNRERLRNRRGGANRDQDHDRFGDRDRGCRVHGNAQLAVVSVFLERMHVRHLGQSQQRQQDKAQERDCPKNLRLALLIAAS